MRCLKTLKLMNNNMKTIHRRRLWVNDPQARAAALLRQCSGKALMPCCPTFTDGLNLCPQLRRINSASADIISCFTLSHRMQEELPTSLLQAKPPPSEQKDPDRDPKNNYRLRLVPNASSPLSLIFSTALYALQHAIQRQNKLITLSITYPINSWFYMQYTNW